MKQKGIIYEINRINKLMGNHLLVESVANRVVTLLDNLVKSAKVRQLVRVDPNANAAYGRLEQTYSNWRAAATGQPIDLSTVLDDLYIVSQRIPEVRIAVTNFILEQDQVFARRFKNYLKNRKQLESANTLPEDGLRQYARDRIRAWYGSAANNLTQSQINILADRLMFDIRRNVSLPPSGPIDNVISKIPLKNLKYLLTQLRNIFKTERALQRKFIDLSDSANEKLLKNNPSGARRDIESMLAIFASSKKNRMDGFDEVYTKWKEDILRDPQSKMTDKDFAKFDNYKESGRGQELFNELTKLDPSFYEQTVEPWLKLWPFKSTKTPGGFWIFSNKMITKDWWERLWMFILTKNARTVREYVGYLQRKGVARGTIELLAWRFLMLRIFLPFMVTVAQAIPSTTEKLLNDFFKSLEGWGINYQVDFTENPSEGGYERFQTNVINSLLGIFLEFSPEAWADQQTYANEAVGFAKCLEMVFRDSGAAPCLNDLFTYNTNAVKKMNVSQEVKNVTLSGIIPKTTKSDSTATNTTSVTTPTDNEQDF